MFSDSLPLLSLPPSLSLSLSLLLSRVFFSPTNDQPVRSPRKKKKKKKIEKPKLAYLLMKQNGIDPVFNFDRTVSRLKGVCRASKLIRYEGMNVSSNLARPDIPFYQRIPSSKSDRFGKWVISGLAKKKKKKKKKEKKNGD